MKPLKIIWIFIRIYIRFESTVTIFIKYVLNNGTRLGCVSDEMANIKKYVSNIEAREAFQKAIKLGDEAGNPIG